MTLEEFYKATEDMPKDMEICIYSTDLYRTVEDVNVKDLWIEGKRKEVITLTPYPVVYAY